MNGGGGPRSSQRPRPRRSAATTPMDSQSSSPPMVDYPARVAMLEEQMKASEKSPAESQLFRTQLCETHTSWMLDDPESAASADCAQRFWKKCFYEHINDYRIRIARGIKKERDIAVLQDHLSAFIKEAITLVEFLIAKLRSALEESTTTGAATMTTTTTKNYGGSKCLYRLYICLGDLYRYDRKLEKADESYAHASRLAPGCPHCYNQRAVVSDCRDNTAISTYWYLRAIYMGTAGEDTTNQEDSDTNKPGNAVIDKNLQQLLEANRSWLLQQQEHQQRNNAGVDTPPLLNNTTTRLFFAKFVDVFYCQYRHIPMTTPYAVVDCVNSFQTLLQSSAFSDTLLCKLIAILAMMRDDMFVVYDFGRCLAERVVKTLQKNKSSRRGLTPLLLLVEYLLLRPATTSSPARMEFWQSIITVYNLVSDQDLDAVDVYLTEYDNLKGYKPFEPFVGRLRNYYLSDTEAVASFGGGATQRPEESPSARIVRFRSLKSNLLDKLDRCVVENTDGTLAFRRDDLSRGSASSPDFFAADEDDSAAAAVVDFDHIDDGNQDMMEYEEGEDIVLDVPTLVVPASKTMVGNATNEPAAAAAPVFPFHLAALMGQTVTAPTTTTTSLPLLSGHVAPYQISEATTPPVLAQAFAPTSVTNSIGPPPGFGGLFSSPLFGDPRPTVPPNVNALFPMNMTTANPFVAGDFNGNGAASGFQSTFAAVSQTKQSPNAMTKNPFAS